jgi:hypothetical protein
MTNTVDTPKDNPLAVKLTKRFMTWDEFLARLESDPDWCVATARNPYHEGVASGHKEC